MVAVGLGLAAIGFGARIMLKTIPSMGQKMAAGMPKFNAQVTIFF